MNHNKILSTEGKVTKQTENGAGEVGCDERQEFGLLNSTTQIILENRTQTISAFKRSRLRIQLF
jgi:hypothetical protein